MDAVRDEKDAVELFENHNRRSEDYFDNVRKLYKEDTDFSNGVQWPPDVRAERETPESRRPCLTINKIDPMVRFIVNGARQQKLAINVKPVGDNGDPDVAEAHLALIHDVEYKSNAKVAYMWAFECMVRGGMGFFRINTEYEAFDSFYQCARIKRIRNPLSVMWDPDAQEPDGSDATCVQIVDEISAEAAKKYNITAKDSIPQGQRMAVWKNGDGIRVGEMFWVEEVPDHLYLLSEQAPPEILAAFQQLGLGQKFLASQVDKAVIEILKQTGGIKADRPTRRRQTKWGKFCAGKLINAEGDAKGIQDWNGRHIPIVPVWGREAYVEGRLDMRGITRNSIDANRMYNYMSSKMVERIALAPIAPWIAAEGQVEPYAKQWKEANVKNRSVLQYKPKTLGGQILPPPQRADGMTGDPTIERYMLISAEDVKGTSNIFDASIGNQSNETSGKAILARTAQGNIATYDLLDSVALAIKQCGRILVDLHCNIIDIPYAVDHVGEDGVAKVIKINQKYQDTKTGKEKFLSLKGSEVAIEVDVGLGDQTRREQAVQTLSNVLNANPQAASLIMDVLVENMDIKNHDKVAKRFKAMLPPQVLAAEAGEQPDSPELDALQQHAEQVIGQLKQQLEEAMARLQELEQQQDNKDADHKLKSRELDIKEMEARAKVELEVIKAQQAADKADGDAASDAAAIRPIMQVQDTMAEEIAAQRERVDVIQEALEKILAHFGPPQSPPESTPAPVMADQGDGTAPDASAQSVGEPNVGQ